MASKQRSSGRKARTAAVKLDAAAKSTAAAHGQDRAVKPGAPLALVHDSSVLDAEESADDTGSDGTDDTNDARASALRAILIDGKDARSVEWRIKRQWPRLKDTAAAIVQSAQRSAEGWKPGSTRDIGGVSKRITSIEALNENYVLVTVPGQPACIARRHDAFFMTRDDFATVLADSVIVTGVDRKGTPKPESAAKVWLSDCRRCTANKIVFTSGKVGPECFNLWTGFGVTPKAGKCDLIHEHIREVICAGDPIKYEAFINLLAWQMQNIGRASRIIVVLYSKEQQVGKGVFIEQILPEIFGQLHGAFTDEFEHYFGRFNDGMRGKAYIALDEACFAGDKKAADKIKSAAATGRMSIEAKGLPKIQLPAGVNIYMATNHEHAAHVEPNDARYWILKVSPHRKGDVAYWTELLKEIDNGGVAALLHGLLDRDVSSFVPQRDVPLQNDERRANQRASDPANPALWLLDCLDNGLWLGSEKWEGIYSPDLDDTAKLSRGALSINAEVTKMLPAFLEGSYRAWAAAQGRHVQAATNGELWKQLTEIGFERRKSGGRRYRAVPTEESIRAEIKSRWGFGDADDARPSPQGTVGTVGDGTFQIPAKNAGKCATSSVSPSFSGESTIQLSPTVPKTEKVDKTASCQGTVGGVSRRDGRDSSRAEVGTVGTVADSRRTVGSGPASRSPSTAHQANGKNGFIGGFVAEGLGKAPRGTQTLGTLDRCSVSAAIATLDDDRCSDFDDAEAGL